MKMKNSNVVSDEEIEKAWGNADFGNVLKVDVIVDTLKKVAQRWAPGHTAMCIIKELGLVENRNKSIGLSDRGLSFLLKNSSNTTTEPINDEGLEEMLHLEIYNAIADNIGNIVIAPTVKKCIKAAKKYAASKLNNSSDETVIKNCLEAARWNMEHANVAPEYQQDFYNINANAICDCEEFLESKLNNSVEDKPELTELLCNGRKVEVNDKDYVVTSATRTTNNSIIFHLSGEKDSLQLKIKQ